MTDLKLIACAAISVAVHFLLARGLEQLPDRSPTPPMKVEIKIVDAPPPPPPPPPDPEPEPTPTPVEPVSPTTQPQRAVRTAVTATVPKTAETSDRPAVSVDGDEPVFGVTMESTPGGPTSTKVGTPGGSGSGGGSGATGKPAAPPPVAAHETSKMPLPQGQCFGKYTDEAKSAGIEGTVLLDLTVGEDGRAREIRVVQGLSHGLNEAATTALRECRFSPGEKGGVRVPVRIRGFKIRFMLQEAR